MLTGAETSGYRLYPAVTAAFAILVLSMWAWYGLRSGMGYETHFPLHSETTDRGRHFGMDMRRFTSMFYHLAYQIGAWTGHAGSYVPYQIAYAVLWLLRGLLVFQIVRMLGDREGLLAVLAGSFTILHAADLSLNWVGQLNQFGFIFWMLLAFVALLKAFDYEHRLLVAVPVAVLATQFARICIYSYESPLPLIFAFPVLAVALFSRWSWRKIVVLGVFYSLPLQYVWRWWNLRVEPGTETTYQLSVLRQDWGATSILADWATNVWHSLAFWQWPRTSMQETGVEFLLVGLVGACVAIAAVSAVTVWIPRSGSVQMQSEERRALAWRLLILGGAMVALSFPAYLLLESATSHWRTQLLAGPGAGIVLGSGAVLVAGTARTSHRYAPRQWAAGLLVTALIGAAVWASQLRALQHRLEWDAHREVVSAMLSIAPRIESDTVIMLVNRRDEPLAFKDNIWWDYAVRLAYPEQRVGGVYFDKPGHAAPGVKVRVSGKSLLVKSDAPRLVDVATLEQLVVLEAGNRVRMVSSLPDWLDIPAGLKQLYKPQTRIGPWPPDPRAVRRFGPIERQ